MCWQRVASLVKFYTNQKKNLLSAERPRYEFRARVLRRIFKQRFSQQNLIKIKEMTRGDKGKLLILFVPLFTLSLLSKILCSLWSLSLSLVTLPVCSLCSLWSLWFDKNKLISRGRGRKKYPVCIHSVPYVTFFV